MLVVMIDAALFLIEWNFINYCSILIHIFGDKKLQG